jgi:hypothetical protein
MFRRQEAAVEAEAVCGVGGDADASVETSSRVDSEAHEDAHAAV